MKFLVTAILFFALSSQAAWIADGGGVTCSNTNPGSVIKGGSNPWPWGMEILFPWTGIQGVWQLSSMGCSSLFVFKVGRDISRNERYVTINQYDPIHCRQLASGVGYEQGRVVRAVMTSPTGSFELTIHAFKPEDLQAYKSGYRLIAEIGEPVVVMRTRPLGLGDVQKANFKLERIQKNPAMLCQ